MKIAIQGELGSFSHQAAQQMVPNGKVIPCARSTEVFDRVVTGSVNAAVIPIENTLAGAVAEHFDLLLAHPVFIQREFQLRIVHNLIAAPEVKFRAIRRVFSHPIALDQCRRFFLQYPQIEALPFYDTAGSVKHIMNSNLRDAAGIASTLAASEYGAHILKRGIEDNKKNFTRFFLIRKAQRILPRANKTSIAFSIKNVPGALFKALHIFAQNNIDLSRIESRPVPGKPWQYTFFVDLLRGRDKVIDSALRYLHKNAEFVKILGIYPTAIQK